MQFECRQAHDGRGLHTLHLEANVAFVDRYLTLSELVEYLVTTDIYVVPYLNPDQIVSGTLAYALGCGKAVISTPFIHAKEALAHGRGLLVPFCDGAAITNAVRRLLNEPGLKQTIEHQAMPIAEAGSGQKWRASTTRSIRWL